LLVDDVEQDVGEDALLVLAKALELAAERFARSLDDHVLELVGALPLDLGLRIVLLRQVLEDEEELEHETVAQPGQIPVLRAGAFGHELGDVIADRLLDHLPDLALEVFTALEREEAQVVDDLALLVHYIVVLEQPFARLEVLHLDPLLRAADGARHERVRDDLAFLRTELLHHGRDALRVEEAHEVVLEGEEELAGARVALTPRATAQLAVDAAGLVSLGADDVQAAGLDD